MTKEASRSARAWSGAALVVVLVWLGMLLGVSFLATPVKFLAPSLSLTVALDVGRHTFAVFNKVEWGFAALLLVLVATKVRTPVTLGAAVLAGLLVVAEALWLLPVLDQRVGMIIAGQLPPPSQLHRLYIVAEVVKALVLAVAAIAILRRLLSQPGAPAGSVSR